MKDHRESLDSIDDGWAPCTPGTFRALKLKNRPNETSRLTGLKPYATGLCLGLLLAAGAVTLKSMSPRTEIQRALTCAEVKPLLVAYAAQELDDDVAAQVREHLAICTPCQAHVDQLVSDPYRALLGATPPRMQLAMVH